MTPCWEYQDLLAEYIAAGEPDLPIYSSLRHHLTTCSACREMARDLNVVEAALESWPLHRTPKGLYGQIMAALDREMAVEAWEPLPWSVWLPTLTLMIALGLTIMLAPTLWPSFQVAQSLEVGQSGLVEIEAHADWRTLWAIWVGIFATLAGFGVTLALVSGRFPNEGEIDHFRQRASDTAHRLWKMAGLS